MRSIHQNAIRFAKKGAEEGLEAAGEPAAVDELEAVRTRALSILKP
jgi:hypothetical protein